MIPFDLSSPRLVQDGLTPGSRGQCVALLGGICTTTPRPVTLTTPNPVAMEKENAGVLPLRPRTRLQRMPQPYVSRVPRVPRAGGPDVCVDGVDDSSRASGAVLLKHRAAWPGTDP